MIEGMHIINQIPIKGYTPLSSFLSVFGITIAIISALVYFLLSKKYPKDITSLFEDTKTKIFLMFYVFGVLLAIISVVHFPLIYGETGRYTYICTFDSDVSVSYLENFKIVSFNDGVWTLEDLE